MKKMLFLGVFMAIAMITVGQVAVTTVSYDSLDVSSKKLFSQYGVANPYGELVKVKIDSIIGVFEITDIPKSRKMVSDSTGTKPEYSTQYMVIYVKDGKNKAFVTIDNPTVNGDSQSSIAGLLCGTGLRQGDDEFPESPVKENNKKDYLLNNEW